MGYLRRRRFFSGIVAFLFAVTLCFLAQGETARAQGLSLIRDAEIENVIRDISAPLFQEAGFSRDSIRIIIVQSNELNAFVAGGHNIFLHTGLLLRAENAGELAGVIAHELSHIASGHLARGHAAMEGISFQAMLAAVLGIAAAVGSGNAEAGAAIMTGGQAAALASFLKYNRTQEASADHGAISYLNGAGLSARGLLSFMEKLEGEELLPSSQQSEYVRTHPLTVDRINFLRHAVGQSRYSDRPFPAVWNKDFPRVQAKLMGFLYPERALNLREGITHPIAARYAKAIALFRKGKLTEAVSMMDDLIEEEPENGYFHELKGDILFEAGNALHAAKSYQKAVELQPDSGLIKIDYAHVLTGIARARQSRDGKAPADVLDKAIGLLQQAKEDENLNPSLYRFLAVAYGMKGEDGYARLNLAEEAVLRNDLDVAERQISYAEANLPEKAAQARLRVADLKEVVAQRRAEMKK
ncbi:MAG: M48 family metalloprotease [Pseudomonadota bacterium]|nr:peptidase M48 family protein [Pseudomonadota bacterium]QKK04816.1 MAG: M48 family metalloprotease [Pseudomonadota bacterium]